MNSTNWERCRVKKNSPSRPGQFWTCGRKKHHNGQHADTKNAPTFYWDQAPEDVSEEPRVREPDGRQKAS